MGRAVSTHSINHLGGRTQTESKLDFAGVVQQSITRHKRLDANTDRVITENFTYDPQNRLLTHTHQVDSNPVEILAQNTYDEISQLTNKKVGGTAASNPLQNIDYAYNIRGWMTKINDPKNLNGKLFGYEIKYNQVEGLETPDALDATLKVLPRYNGNIAEVDWRTGTVQGDYLRRYGYVYDRLNRLSAGFYQADANPSAKEYFEKMVYDVNGNIANLKRSAARGQNTTAFAIDNLTYVYANSNTGNRLVSVTDSSGDYRGYPDTSGTAIEYDDPSGNMKSYKDKGILNINYNFLNLPDQITFDRTYLVRNLFGGVTETRNINTKYLYRADGAKMNKLYTYGIAKNQSEVLKMTEYFDGFQYETEGASLRTVRILKFVPTAEGYYNFENNKYIYNYVDHLGNVRLSYFNNGSSTEVLEENNYYPFGLKHEGYNLLAGNLSYQYKYNGKELQTESGMYDYGARFYMPDIGRWGVVDPLAETSRRWSTYAYAYNNPIRFIDPDGMQNYDITFGKNISAETQNKIVSDLEKETGLKLSVESNGKLSYKESSGAGGSETARNMIKGAIDNHRTDYQINSDNSRGTSIDPVGSRGEMIDGVYGSTVTYDLNINTDQIDKFIAGTSQALNPLTMGYGMSTLHEISHEYNNLRDQNSIYGSPGDNEKVINTIRTELDNSKQFNLPFGQRKSYSPMDILYKGKLHNFTPFEKDPAVMNYDFNKINLKKNLFILTPKTK